MKTFDTIIEAINDLRSRGYIEDFSIKPYCIKCTPHNLELHPEDFTIEEHYRFEGISNPDDNSIVYAIQSKDGLKGILVDAYGMYAENLTPEMGQKMKALN